MLNIYCNHQNTKTIIDWLLDYWYIVL